MPPLRAATAVRRNYQTIKEGRCVGVASFVLGIIAFTPFLPFPIDLITATVGLILGVIGKRKLAKAGDFTSLATAGIVLSSIVISITVLGRLLWIIL
jgi:hypothetical protein